MPRVSQAEKARNHQRILEEAARQIRSSGIEGLGIAELMKSVGMTHGGFYRHFKDKEELAVAAIDQAFDVFCDRLENEIDELGSEEALGAFVRRYLSTDHVENPSAGCPASALSGEAGRCSLAERKAIARGIARTETLLARALSEAGTEGVLAAECLFSLLVGTVVLARAATSKSDAEGSLEKARDYLEKIGVPAL